MASSASWVTRSPLPIVSSVRRQHALPKSLEPSDGGNSFVLLCIQSNCPGEWRLGGPPSRDQRRQSWYSCQQKIVGRNRIGHPYPWGEAWSLVMTGLYWSSYFPGLSGFHSFSSLFFFPYLSIGIYQILRDIRHKWWLYRYFSIFDQLTPEFIDVVTQHIYTFIY